MLQVKNCVLSIVLYNLSVKHLDFIEYNHCALFSIYCELQHTINFRHGFFFAPVNQNPSYMETPPSTRTISEEEPHVRLRLFRDHSCCGRSLESILVRLGFWLTGGKNKHGGSRSCVGVRSKWKTAVMNLKMYGFKKLLSKFSLQDEMWVVSLRLLASRSFYALYLLKPWFSHMSRQHYKSFDIMSIIFKV